MPDVLEIIYNLNLKLETAHQLAGPTIGTPMKKALDQFNIALADLRARVVALQEENTALKAKVSVLEKMEDVRSKVVFRDGVYWIDAAFSGSRPLGPYCTGCLDGSQKLILLREMPKALNMVGKYECPVCTQYFGQ